jgi:hypothetical protein
MKITLVIGILLFQVQVNAAVLLVNNAPNSPGQYAQINAAITAASPGDTIYVSGTTVVYNNVTITKSITLIGPGKYSQTQYQFPATISNIQVGSGIGNIKIRGFEITSGITASNLNGTHDLEISNCLLLGLIDFSNCTNTYNVNVKNNIINSSANVLWFTGVTSAAGNYNFMIENNIIKGSFFALTLAGTIIQHNIFIGNGTTAFNNACANFNIKNNIFYGVHPLSNVSACVYENNISYNNSIVYPLMGGTNLDNIDPLFVNVPNQGIFNIGNNYHLLSNSPGVVGATDLTDIGIYGGSANMSTSLETQHVPVIRIMNVTNSSVPQNESEKYQIENELI